MKVQMSSLPIRILVSLNPICNIPATVGAGFMSNRGNLVSLNPVCTFPVTLVGGYEQSGECFEL